MANFTSWGATVSSPNSSASGRSRPRGVAGTGAPAAWDAPQAAYQPPAAAIPLDPIYQSQLGAFQSKRDSQLAQFAAARPRALADYGYTASGYDTTGAPTGLQFDVNNPFSRAALLQRSAQQQKAGTTTSMAARGQLHSSSYDRVQQANEFNYQQGSDALIKALVGSLVNIASQEAGVKSDYDIGAAQALGDSVGRAQSQPPPPAPPPGPEGSPSSTMPGFYVPPAGFSAPDGDYNRTTAKQFGFNLGPGWHLVVRGGLIKLAQY